MNIIAENSAPGRRIDLTREPEFALSAVQFRPSACEASIDGRRIRLQPRVMQVMIAMARARDQPVSRETLIEVCWGPLSVSDDALNRCIQRLRRLAEDDAAGAFAIETIPKIGYRLTIRPEAQSETRAGVSGRGAVAKPYVTVRPFANLTGETEQGPFAVGMTEEVSRSLSRIRTLFVVADGQGPSSRSRKPKPRDPARDSSGWYALQGSIRKADGRVRIAVQLIDAFSGFQLWARHFEETPSDVFALQDDVALAVAAAVEPAVVAAEVRWVLKHPSDNPGSYELYLRAQPHCTRRSLAAYLTAIDLFNRAIALDPNCRSALALAAHLHSSIAVFGWAEDPDANRRRGIELARRALIVDGDDAVVVAHAAIAIARLEKDLDAATTLFKRAVGLNPASSYAWFLSGLHQANHGDPDTAILHVETSLRLDPLAHRSNAVGALAAARYRQGRLDEAVTLANESVLKTDSPQSYAFLIGAHAQLGQLSAAQRALSRYRALTTLPIEATANAILPEPAERQRFLESVAAVEAMDRDGRRDAD